MVICCAAPNCTNRQGKEKRGAVSFHRFPLKDPVRLTLWTAALQRSNWTPGPYSFLCSEHFSPDSFVPRMPDQHPLLKSSAVPCIFQGNKESNQRRCSSGVKKRVKTPKSRPNPTNQESISAKEPSTESRCQTSIIISDDFKDSSCLLISGVSNSLTACKFISSLHSYSSSSKSTSSSVSHETATVTVVPHIVNTNAECLSNQPSYAETNLSSYVAVNGVFTSNGEASGDTQCQVEDSNKDSIGNGSLGTLPYYLEVHCENSELVTEEAKEPSHFSEVKVCFPPVEESDPYSVQAINSLHSYCSSSQKSLSGRRTQLSKKACTTDTPFESQCWNTCNQSTQGSPPLHPAVAPLAWMLGSWVSEPAGEGEFPTIQPFHYNEEAFITHAGQPMLNFMFCASHPESGKPLHRESGFIRVKPGTNHVAFICAQNIGVVEIEEGEVQGQQLCLTSHSLSRTSFANEPHVHQISRTFCLTPEGKLEQTVSMATSNQPLAPHLHVTYRKVTS